MLSFMWIKTSLSEVWTKLWFKVRHFRYSESASFIKDASDSNVSVFVYE